MELPSDIDPTIFTKDRELDLEFALTQAAEQYSVSLEIIERFEREHSPETQTGRVKQLEDDEAYKKIAGMVGETFAADMISEVVAISEDDVTDEAHAEAQEAHGESQSNLMGYVFGYHDHIADGLQNVFDDQEEIDEMSWSNTWQKLRDTLHPVGKTYLAEVAVFFDSLVRAKYTDYDPIDLVRGASAGCDISARTFYEVMQDHLSRAMMRPTEDGWTGPY